MNLGGRIRQRRNELTWTQGALCDRVNLGLPDGEGLTQQALGVLEKRDSKTSEFAVRIADALGVSVRWLMDGSGQPGDTDWPFSRVNRARWDACSPEDRAYIQAAINRALDDCERDRTPSASTEMKEAPAKKAPALAAKIGGPRGAKLSIRSSDADPNQRPLPLATVTDPFTAQPDDREKALYDRLSRSVR